MLEVNIHIRSIIKSISFHPLFLLVLTIVILSRNLKIFLLMYSIVMIHELFHLFAAYKFNVKIKGIKIMPFGMTLEIKDDYIKKPEHEILIALAGPFSNMLMIIMTYMLKAYCLFNTDDMTFFILGNMIIGLVNLLPILPLDGGRMLRAALTLQLGIIRAFQITLKLTKLFSALFLILGIYIWYITGFNTSVLLISIFTIFNIIDERERGYLTVMKEVIYCKEKLLKAGILKVKNMAVAYNIPAQKLLKYFSYNYFCLITVVDNEMQILGTLTEVQIVLGLIALGSKATVEEIINYFSTDFNAN